MLNFLRIFYKTILLSIYKVTIKANDILASEYPKLILVNHVSHVDPQLMSICIYKHTEFVPVVAEGFFKIPVIKYFLRKFDAVKVPSLKNAKGNPELFKNIDIQILKALNNDKSALIFPAGQLSLGGLEKIGNKQSAFSIASQIPDKAKIIGVRITGLYGSIWSTAWNGKRPEFFSTYLLGIIYFFANFFFFCPRRKVTIEFVDITEKAKEKAQIDRKDFNSFLEEFYNENGPEKPIFIRHLFYFPRIRNKVRVV